MSNKNYYKFNNPKTPQLVPLENIDKISFFYQICIFPDKKTQKYHMRKFIIKNNVFESIYDYHLSKDQCKKFFDIKKSFEYRSFPAYNLNNIEPPNMNDVLLLKSNMLNNHNKYNSHYTDFAPLE